MTPRERLLLLRLVMRIDEQPPEATDPEVEREVAALLKRRPDAACQLALRNVMLEQALSDARVQLAAARQGPVTPPPAVRPAPAPAARPAPAAGAPDRGGRPAVGAPVPYHAGRNEPLAASSQWAIDLAPLPDPGPAGGEVQPPQPPLRDLLGEWANTSLLGDLAGGPPSQPGALRAGAPQPQPQPRPQGDASRTDASQRKGQDAPRQDDRPRWPGSRR